MFQLTPNTNPPLKVALLVNHTPITMEINTGASTSLIHHNTFIKLFGSASKLMSTQAEFVHTLVKLSNPLVKQNWNLHIIIRKLFHVIIMKGSYSNLLGRDILQKIKLNWEE